MKYAALALSVVVVARGLAQDPPAPPSELLERTVQQYRRAASGCVLAARITRFGRGATMSSESRSGFHITRSQSSVRFEPLTEEAVWGVKAGRAFLFLRARKDYLETEETSVDGNRIIRQIDHWYQRLGGKFANWPSLDAKFTFVKMDQLPTASGRKRCAVVGIDPTDQSLRWSERVWIDAETGLIWKAVMRWPALRNAMETEETVTWETIDIGPVPEESTGFTPPPSFRRLDHVPFALMSVKP